MKTSQKSDEPFDDESYLYIAKKAGLSFEEMQMMDMGQVMDYITEYVNSETKQSEDKPKANKANQAMFDSF
ncbi:hypothetical protein C122C_0821 [Leuconostoc gelidum subsp. gasicomitatum]|uniref:Uncharacterized protein n=1 Tax=Leuconostoc gasicomitatum TaxID=115778 RepID=A0ABM9V3L0_9LACO|nr:hypothetical protein [Leuconostoc gasicomitatum]CUR63459.1 Uncharacterized protein LEKG_0872 [Leuconostoc gasicomitatum KG16-1]CUW10588.1 hypothetical protein C122C_0821 [Leuconostoc gasicomitatum]